MCSMAFLKYQLSCRNVHKVQSEDHQSTIENSECICINVHVRFTEWINLWADELSFVSFSLKINLHIYIGI